MGPWPSAPHQQISTVNNQHYNNLGLHHRDITVINFFILRDIFPLEMVFNLIHTIENKHRICTIILRSKEISHIS